MNYKDNYLPIDPDFFEVIEAVKENARTGKVHFFDPKNAVDDAVGNITELRKNSDGMFIVLSDAKVIRLDKIITLYGRPGPAYDRYDAFANACLTCEDLGQFY